MQRVRRGFQSVGRGTLCSLQCAVQHAAAPPTWGAFGGLMMARKVSRPLFDLSSVSGFSGDASGT